MRFTVGQTVVRRCLYRDGRISAVESARVVQDDERGLLTWTGAGSEVMRRTTFSRDSIRKMPLAERAKIPTMLAPTAWHGGGILVLTPPEANYSVWWFFDASGSFEGWYINLELNVGRWSSGVDAQDQALDVWVAPDRSWQWKDEDEFEERTDHPLYWTSAEAPTIRAEGERLISLALAAAFPFDGSWTDFRPDPQWTPTTMPPNWDAPR